MSDNVSVLVPVVDRWYFIDWAGDIVCGQVVSVYNYPRWWKRFFTLYVIVDIQLHHSRLVRSMPADELLTEVPGPYLVQYLATVKKEGG